MSNVTADASADLSSEELRDVVRNLLPSIQLLEGQLASERAQTQRDRCNALMDLLGCLRMREMVLLDFGERMTREQLIESFDGDQFAMAAIDRSWRLSSIQLPDDVRHQIQAHFRGES